MFGPHIFSLMCTQLLSTSSGENLFLLFIFSSSRLLLICSGKEPYRGTYVIWCWYWHNISGLGWFECSNCGLNTGVMLRFKLLATLAMLIGVHREWSWHKLHDKSFLQGVPKKRTFRIAVLQNWVWGHMAFHYQLSSQLAMEGHTPSYPVLQNSNSETAFVGTPCTSDYVHIQQCSLNLVNHQDQNTLLWNLFADLATLTTAHITR